MPLCTKSTCLFRLSFHFALKSHDWHLYSIQYLCIFKLVWLRAYYLQNEQGYFIPICSDSMCIFKFLFDAKVLLHMLHGYFFPVCLVLKWFCTHFLLFAWKSHELHIYILFLHGQLHCALLTRLSYLSANIRLGSCDMITWRTRIILLVMLRLNIRC